MNEMIRTLMFVTVCGVQLCVAESIDTIAGTGNDENNGDAGPALQINIKDPFGVEYGPDDALYVTEVGHHRVRRIEATTGRVSTVAGDGEMGYAGDGGPATKAKLNEPYEVRFDALGNMYFVEMQNHLVRMVSAKTKTISTIAGTGEMGFGGDGGPAVDAKFSRPHSIALDGRGGLYIADIGNHRIRRVDLETGIIETIAGNGEKSLPVDGQLARGKPILGPRALYIRGQTMWIALREGNSVWRLDMTHGTLHHVAGSGAKGYQNGAPQQATFNGPKGIVVDSHDNVFVVDTENQVIRRIDGATRIVTTVVGKGQRGAAGDGGDALQAEMGRPHGICLSKTGSLVIGDTLNHRVREVK